MVLSRLLHLVIFSSLLILAAGHPLADQSDITVFEPRSLSSPSSDPRRLNLREATLSRRFPILEGYRLALTNRIQILPIFVAAEELRIFWSGVMLEANAKWQSNDRVLSVYFGRLLILFDSGNENLPLDWTGIVFLASYMKDNVCTGGGWAGFFEGTMTNVATQVVMRVTMQYV